MKVLSGFSIIIPAYNETSVISKTLSKLLEDQRLNNVEIIVVCNACTDSTAEKTNNFKTKNADYFERQKITLSLIETPLASKTNAINLGIKHTNSDNIILLDADISISGENILCLLDEMQISGALVASPAVKFIYKNSNFFVKAYYRVAEKSFYNLHLRISNVIAISKEGQLKLNYLPNVIADDEFIRLSFPENERLVVKKCHFQFSCPKNINSLIKTLTRVKIGNMQLAKLKTKNLVSQPNFKRELKISPNLVIFGIIKLIALFRAYWQVTTNSAPKWERDESTRKVDKFNN